MTKMILQNSALQLIFEETCNLMTKIVMRRPPEWSNRLRSYKLILNGVETGIIARDEIQEYIVPPGKHKMRAVIGWLGSEEYAFEIKQGETLYFKVTTDRWNSSWSRVGLFSVVAYLLFAQYLIPTSETSRERIFYSALVTLLIVLVYQLTLGKKKHLKILPDVKR